MEVPESKCLYCGEQFKGWPELNNHLNKYNCMKDTAPAPQQDSKEWERLNGKNVDTAGMTMEPQQERNALVELIGEYMQRDICFCESCGSLEAERFADAILAAYRLEKR